MDRNYNLPPGTTLSDVEGEEQEYQQCSTCDGYGHTGSECCGEHVGDIGLCPRCKEHASNEECPDCHGEGEVQV